MDVRDLGDLRKEVHSLDDSSRVLADFREAWIAPLKDNANGNFSFLRDLPNNVKDNVNSKLQVMDVQLDKAQRNVKVQEKIRSHVRQLIDWKLANFQGNHAKAKMLTSQLLNDDYMSLPATIAQLREYDTSIKMVESHYHEITELLHKTLSLDEAVYMMQMPHLKYLATLKRTAEKQKFIVRDLGRHLVSIADQQNLRKMPLR